MTPHEIVMFCLLAATGVGGVFYVRWLTKNTAPESEARPVVKPETKSTSDLSLALSAIADLASVATPPKMNRMTMKKGFAKTAGHGYVRLRRSGHGKRIMVITEEDRKVQERAG